jgi:pilus assembly protein CpaE
MPEPCRASFVGSGMERPRAQRTESEHGQASIEFLGVLPAAVVVVIAAWQLLVAGQAVWLAGNAARVAARAATVGRDPRAAARSALPSYLRRRLAVESDPTAGRVTVRVRPPLVLGHWASPIRVEASAAMEPQAP